MPDTAANRSRRASSIASAWWTSGGSSGANGALMTGAGRAVVLFELAFPLGLLSARLLAVMLALAAAFHLANALLFGLNRFLWTWLSAFPALWWLQGRLFGG